jgi:hypothetical protein
MRYSEWGPLYLRQVWFGQRDVLQAAQKSCPSKMVVFGSFQLHAQLLSQQRLKNFLRRFPAPCGIMYACIIDRAITYRPEENADVNELYRGAWVFVFASSWNEKAAALAFVLLAGRPAVEASAGGFGRPAPNGNKGTRERGCTGDVTFGTSKDIGCPSCDVD